MSLRTFAQLLNVKAGFGLGELRPLRSNFFERAARFTRVISNFDNVKFCAL